MRLRCSGSFVHRSQPVSKDLAWPETVTWVSVTSIRQSPWLDPCLATDEPGPCHPPPGRPARLLRLQEDTESIYPSSN